MSDQIPARDLRPGDVLLYRGHGLLAEAIRFFDGTDVSHAGLLVARDAVGEALGNGLERRDLATSYGDHEWVMARRIKPPVMDLAPVTDRGQRFLKEGHKYAYEQILLLAFLGLTRKLSPSPVLRALLRSVLDRAAEALERWLGGGRQPMICSEFVYRCYDEALPDREDAYTLHVNVPPHAPAPVAGARARAGGPVIGRAKGQGVHPESLLAWAMAPSSRGRVAESRAMAPRSARAARRRVTDRELERQIEAYLGEARGARAGGVRRVAGARGAVAPPRVNEHELLDAVDRFAIAYHAAARPPVRAAARFTPRAGESVSATGAPPIRTLAGAVADFVTPGDLLNCQDLMTLGKIRI